MTALSLIARYLSTPAPALSFRRPLVLHVGMLLRSKRLGATYQVVAIHGDAVTVQLYRRRNREMYPGRVRMTREQVAERMEAGQAEERWREFYVEWVACSYCAGAGDDPHGGEPECPVCGGHGETQRRCYLDDEEADDWEAERLTGTLPGMEVE